MSTLAAREPTESFPFWLLQLLVVLRSAIETDHQDVRGAECRHYLATVEGGHAWTVLPDRWLDHRGDLPIEVWIDEKFVRRVQIYVGRRTQTLELWDFGVPINAFDWTHLPTFAHLSDSASVQDPLGDGGRAAAGSALGDLGATMRRHSPGARRAVGSESMARLVLPRCALMAATALITGVGRRQGIGASIAAGLAADGWDLVLSYWHPYDDRIGLERGADDPETLARELREGGRTVELVPADLEDAAMPERLVQRAMESVGPLDALVMSHCESVDSGVLDTTVESFDRHYAVNVRAGWLLIGAFARQLPASGGCVVALTSDHTVGNLPYGATKSALDRVVLAAAHELGHLGLRANVINPGPIDTGWMDPQTRADLTVMQPTGRLGTATDTANLVRFLVSEQGQWINGQLLRSNGGFPAGQLPV